MENPKFNLLNESLKAIQKGSLNLLCVKGEPGTGKSRTILNFLNENKVNFNYFSSYTTPLYFYRLLYENQDKEVLIFDDIEGITDLKIIAMLKSLCWNPENKSREICYFSTTDKMGELGLPSRFTTNARIILIFNNDLRGFKAVINRGLCIDFNFNFQEKINIFNEMKEKAEISQEVLNWVNLNCNESTENLSLRSLVILSNLKRDGFDFEMFAKEILKGDDEIKVLLDVLNRFKNIEDACNEWIKIVGKSRRSFFRVKGRIYKR
jgi:hypothetical protein